MKYEQIRVECCELNKRLPQVGLVDLTFGNASVLDVEAGVFAIKPSGVDYDKLTPESMVIVDLEGSVVEGSLRPSSDTPTHRCLLHRFSENGIRSIIHTHSRNAVAFAQAGMEIPCLGTTHADHFYGAVPVTREMTTGEIAKDYEWNTGMVIMERFKTIDSSEVPAVLVRNHGPFVWGTSPEQALENARALEIVAEMALKTLSLSPGVKPLFKELLNKHFLRKHGKSAYYGQD